MVEERKEIIATIEEKTYFPICIRFTDGFHIPMVTKPTW
jgi:hypothetical protein